MQAKEGFFYELLSGKDKKFCVPVYQRKYSWNLNNCKRFYEDLTNIIDKNLLLSDSIIQMNLYDGVCSVDVYRIENHDDKLHKS